MFQGSREIPVFRSAGRTLSHLWNFRSRKSFQTKILSIFM